MELDIVDNIQSPFFQESIVFQAALLPSQSSNLLDGVKQQINALLLNYSEDLKGIPLSYTDIKFPRGKEYCRIIGEDHWLHIDVTTKILVFRPVIGIILTGRITMISDSHLSLLVYQMLNASITGDNFRKYFIYDDKIKAW